MLPHRYVAKAEASKAMYISEMAAFNEGKVEGGTAPPAGPSSAAPATKPKPATVTLGGTNALLPAASAASCAAASAEEDSSDEESKKKKKKEKKHKKGKKERKSMAV